MIVYVVFGLNVTGSFAEDIICVVTVLSSQCKVLPLWLLIS